MQDVWDKFYELKLSLLSQQRHETEALWMVQLDQWMDRLAELGKIFVSFAQNRMLHITIPWDNLKNPQQSMCSSEEGTCPSRG